MKINQTFKNLKRLKEIGGVFARHGFSKVVEDLGLGRVIPTHETDDKGVGPAAPVRLRMAFDELGPSFVKLGQMLALRPDLIPAEYAEEFRKLQDKASPMPFAMVLQQIEQEFDAPPAELFASIEERPLGQASIAQVHRAVLADGRQVVIKVRRVGIEQQIEGDIGLFYTIARLLDDYLPAVSVFNPMGIVDEFARVIRGELDFIQEGQNIARFGANFAESPDVVIPGLVFERSGQRVLTMDFLDGLPLSRLDAVRAAGHDTRRIVDLGARAFLKMVFVDAYFHGDIHGGNVLVLRDGRLGFLDFGVVGHLDKRLLDDIASIFLAIVSRDFRAVARSYLNLASSENGSHVSTDAFARDLQAVIEPLLGVAIKDIQTAVLLEQVATVARRYHMQIPRDLLLLGRALATLEGLARDLDPEFNLMPVLTEFAGTVIAERYKPERLAVDLISGLRELADLGRDLPGQLQSLVRNAESGNLAVEVRLREPSFFRALRREAYRMASAVLLCGGAIALAVSSANDHGGFFSGFVGALLLSVGTVGFLLSLLRDFKKL